MMLELRQKFWTLSHPFEEVIFCVMTKLERAIDRVVRVLVLGFGEIFRKCKETRTANAEPDKMVSSRTFHNVKRKWQARTWRDRRLDILDF